VNRLKPLDALLLATVAPLWAAWFAFLVWAAVAGRAPWEALGVDTPTDRARYPTVAYIGSHWAGGGGLAVGDTVLAVGDDDLRGVGQIGLDARLREAGARSFAVPITIERAGERRSLVLDLGLPWFELYPRAAMFRSVWNTLSGIAYGLTAILILVKGRGAPAARPLFLALILCSFPWGFWPVGPRLQTYVLAGLACVGFTLGVPFFLRAAQMLAGGPTPSGLRAWWPFLFSLAVLWGWSGVLFGTLSSEQGWLFQRAIGVAFVLSMFVVLTLGLRRADPQVRRRIKWVVYGFYLLYVPALVHDVLDVWIGGEATFTQWVALDALRMAQIFLPICILIAVVRFNLFDIDRLLSATASYTILAILVLAGALAVVPRVAAATGAFMGMDASAAQLLLSLVLAAVVVPAHRRLRPQIERVFFRERHAVERGVADLLEELSAGHAPEELFRLAGERLGALLRPDSCVLYVRARDAFAPAFVRGQAVPPAFDPRSPLIAALEGRSRPMVAERWAGGRDLTGLGPFDRAALETLGSAVVLPIHRGQPLVAFLCLGGKRSGDVYTTTDLALLGSVGHAVSRELLRFDDAELLRQARAMQEALRRYVPVPVAAELGEGGGLPATERDVAVLFADIRGYTTYAEGRRAEEIFTTTTRFTDAISRVVRDHGGTVAEFTGDGIMAVFGAPAALAQKERAAVEAGRDLIAVVGSLPLDGGRPLAIGVGIASGPVYAGDVRADDHLIWTVVGNAPNLAARLQALTRDLDAAIVIDAVTWRRAGYVAADFLRRERVAVRGRTAPEDVYLLPLAPAALSVRT
jgi:class 3 adenylate cyclase